MVFDLTYLPRALLVIPLLALVELAKAARWRILMGASRPDYVRCLRALVAGQLANALVPIRGGEVLSITLIKLEGGSLMSGTAALAATKALDAVCLAAIALTVLGMAALNQSRLVLLAAGATLLAAALLAIARPEPALRLLRKPLFQACRFDALLDVAAVLRNWRALVAVLVLTLTVWVAGLAANWPALAASGITPSLDLAARMLVAGYIVGLLPAPPARLGVFEGGIAAALVSAGAALPAAVAAGLLLHLALLAELGLLLGASGLASLAMRRSSTGLEPTPTSQPTSEWPAKSR